MAIKHEVHRTYTDRKLHRTPLERLKWFKSLRAVCSQRLSGVTVFSPGSTPIRQISAPTGAATFKLRF